MYNRTFEYLVPIVRTFGDEFLYNYRDTIKQGFAVQDYCLTERSKFKIFIKFKINYSFNRLLDYLEDKSYFYKTYETSIKGDEAVIVFNIPEEYHNAYLHFLNGHFSKMYNERQLKLLYPPLKSKDYHVNKRQVTREILYRTDRAAEAFLETINETYNTTLKIEDIMNHEFDKHDNLFRDECFNFEEHVKPLLNESI
jgi:hypothetical protein